GGTGSVGRTLLDYLDRCHAAYGRMHVTVLTRDADAFVSRHPMQARRRWLTLVGGSLSALQPLSDDVTDVIHAAADTHMGSGRADWVDQIVG
ncbi:hypothetical protein ABTK07_19320, partial [Acinetobacter baumannii]